MPHNADFIGKLLIKLIWYKFAYTATYFIQVSCPERTRRKGHFSSPSGATGVQKHGNTTFFSPSGAIGV